MSRRLSPKEIKEDIRHDELRTWIERFADWLVVHEREAKIGAAAILGALIVVAASISWLGSRAEAANERLAKAMEVLEAPLTGDTEAPKPAAGVPRFATDDERWAAAVERFREVPGLGSGDAGAVADLFLARAALRDEKASEAIGLWRGFLDGHKGSGLAAAVELNLYRLRRDQGEAEQVATDLRRELDQPGGDLPDDVVIFELAQTLEKLGQTDEARTLYQRLVDEHPQSTYTSKARQRTAESA